MLIIAVLHHHCGALTVLVSTITSDAAFLEIEGVGVIEKVAVGIPTFVIVLIICLSFDYRIFLLVLALLIPTWFAYRYLATRQDVLNLNRQKLIGTVTEDKIDFIKEPNTLKMYNNGGTHRKFLGGKNNGYI